jgi:hypothetical protein
MCLISYPSSGTHSITASYSGDPNFAASSSTAQTLTVGSTPEVPIPPLDFPEEDKPSGTKLDGTSIPVHAHAAAVVKLACNGIAVCKGTLSLSVRETVKDKHGKKLSRSVKIGSETFSISAGKTVAVAIHLNATGRALLASHKGQISAALKLAEGSGSTQATVRLTSAKPGGKKG